MISLISGNRMVRQTIGKIDCPLTSLLLVYFQKNKKNVYIYLFIFFFADIFSGIIFQLYFFLPYCKSSSEELVIEIKVNYEV